jgi:hypothetical protein
MSPMACLEKLLYSKTSISDAPTGADWIGRTNRGLGVSELKIIHSLKDFLSLPNAKDRETAKGFAQRCGVLGLMALSLDDLHALSAVQPLNGKEIATVAGFITPPDWKPT